MTLSLNNSNKDLDFVGWVIKTSWLIYFRSVKFHYVEKTHMMLVALVKIVVVSQHKRQLKNICQDLLRKWKHLVSDLKASARAALCKWATRTRQTCLSKTFANSPNKQKLSKQVLVMIKQCLGNCQINSIPAWSKESSYITFLRGNKLIISRSQLFFKFFIKVTFFNKKQLCTLFRTVIATKHIVTHFE